MPVSLMYYSCSTPHPATSSFPFLFFSLLPPPPTSTLFPYTTLFRSDQRDDQDEEGEGAQHVDHEADDLVDGAHHRGGRAVGLEQGDAQGQAQQHRQRHGHPGHVQGGDGVLPQTALPAVEQGVLRPFLQGLDHEVTSWARTPASSSSAR